MIGTENKLKAIKPESKHSQNSNLGNPIFLFFADLERKSSKKKHIGQLMNTQREIKNEVADMKNIATNFYTSLFDSKIVDNKAAPMIS